MMTFTVLPDHPAKVPESEFVLLSESAYSFASRRVVYTRSMLSGVKRLVRELEDRFRHPRTHEGLSPSTDPQGAAYTWAAVDSEGQLICRLRLVDCAALRDTLTPEQQAALTRRAESRRRWHNRKNPHVQVEAG